MSVRDVEGGNVSTDEDDMSKSVGASKIQVFIFWNIILSLL